MEDKVRGLALDAQADDRGGDAILEELMTAWSQNCPRLFDEVLSIWQNSSDRISVEAMFYSLSGVEFGVFLDRCVSQMEARND